MTATLSTPTITMPVDPEHAALRLTIVSAFLGLWGLGFAAVNGLVAGAGFNLIAIVISCAAAGAVTSLVIEPQLKKRWPSGRQLELDERGARLTLKGRVQKEIRAQEPASVVLWRFQVTRGRSRVPKGWYVIACALQQDDSFLTAYTFASPEQAMHLAESARFVTLSKPAEHPIRGAQRESLQVAGEQRRARAAESHRWNDGAEMTSADFERFLAWVKDHYSA